MQEANNICRQLIEAKFDVNSHESDSDKVEYILVNHTNIVEVVSFLKLNSPVKFNILLSINAVDSPENFEVLYYLYATESREKLVLKCLLNKANPQINSISTLFKTADWNEREAFDLMGIKFLNHPDLKRILLPVDWIGHPLRKDYKMEDKRLAWNER